MRAIELLTTSIHQEIAHKEKPPQGQFLYPVVDKSCYATLVFAFQVGQVLYTGHVRQHASVDIKLLLENG